jgi:hypothetical protein
MTMPPTGATAPTMTECEVAELSIAAMSTDQIAAELQERVQALYRLNRELAAHVDRMRPVVDSALRSVDYYAQYPDSLNGYEIDLRDRVQLYRAQMAQLAKENCDA